MLYRLLLPALLLSALCPAALRAAAPDIPPALRPAPPDWAALELSIPVDERRRLLNTIFADEELRLTGVRTPAAEAAAHIVDINLDGRADVLYHGLNGSDIPRIVVFMGSDSGVVRVAAWWGELIGVERTAPLGTLTITLVDYPCCAGYTLYHTSYTAVQQSGVWSFEQTSCTAYTATTAVPPQFATPVPFVVTGATADLRAMPEISTFQPERFRGVLPNPGNLLGAYPQGSTGVILARQTDAEGEDWYFVRLARNLPAAQDIVHHGQNGETSFGILGWLRARDLAPR